MRLGPAGRIGGVPDAHLRGFPDASGAGRGDARVMNLIATTTFSLPAMALIAGFLMVVAGVGKKRLRWRTVECPVCHHPRGSCTCRWL